MALSRPYIMDLPAMNDKMEGNHVISPTALPTPILKELIREFVRLEAHCDQARGLCEHNVGLIIKGQDPIPYPTITIP